MPGQDVAIVGVRIAVKRPNYILSLQWAFILQFLNQVKALFPTLKKKTQRLFCYLLAVFVAYHAFLTYCVLCTYRSDGNFWDAASSAMRPIICRDQLWFFRQIATQRVNWLRWYLDYISLVLAQCGKHQERFLSWSYRHSPIRFRETLSFPGFFSSNANGFDCFDPCSRRWWHFSLPRL